MTEAQTRARNAIGEAASEWVVLLSGRAATAADKAAFMEWLRQSPLHVQEYLRAEVAFLELQGAAAGDATPVEALLAQAPRNVIDLGAMARAADIRSPAARESRRRTRRFASIAAAAAVLLAVGAVFTPGLMEQLRTDTYATATGEQRRVVLPDGSTIDLNTQTKLRVRFTDTARDIQLSGGEAYFTVAKDPGRPFAVTASNRQVRALGTAFIVRDDLRQLSVTLIEGKVTIGPVDSEHGTVLKATGAQASKPPVPLALVPGQRVTFAATGEAARLDSPAIEKVTAWRERRLIVENQTIAEVAAEFNRYNTRQIVIDDARLAEERINGVFDADKPQNLLDFLVRNTAAHIEERADRLVVTRASSTQ